MAPPPRLVLVDGSAMLFRAYYSHPNSLRTSTGIPTNATFGFATMFRKLFAGRTPDKGAVVFDAPGRTFRDEKYPEYKANRESAPDDLNLQRPWVDKIVAANGFPVIRVPGYEADDVIGTLTERGVSQGMEVIIVSADKDFVQLLRPGVKMLDSFREVTYDESLAKKKWGIEPEKFVDLLALMGDKIDNIPGVPGIGRKGAAELLEAYGTLEGVFAHLSALKGRQKAALEKHAESARISRELATIDRRAPVPIALEDLTLPPLDEARLNRLYTELEFNSLLTEAQVSATEEAAASETTEVLTGEELSEWFRFTPPRTVALEVIGDTPAVGDKALVGLALSKENGRAIYIDLRRDAPQHLIGWLGDPSYPKVVHGAKRGLLMLEHRGFHLEGITGDLELASFLVDPEKLIPHRLDQISKEYLQRPLPPVKRILGSGKKELRFRQIDVPTMAGWAGRRAVAVFEAWPKLQDALRREGQTGHLLEVDLPLSRVLARMERAGILVDGAELERVEHEFSVRLGSIEEDIYRLAGRPLNLRSPKQLAEVLFEELNLPVIKRTKTGYSTDAEVLERLASKHPIAERLLEQRKLEKLINTYTRVLREAVDAQTGRIHATFQQTVGVTGRLISTDPDLQRTPIKTPEGERIRHAFIAPSGHTLVSADWSQIELRILAHVSGDPLLLDAFQRQLDVHAKTASELFGTPIEEVSRDQRRVGKTVNFATVYGQGASALGQILKIPRKEAETYIKEYFRTYAGVRAWRDRTIEDAKSKGFVETIHGRRRYIPELSSNAFMERAAGERIAVNTPIQGSAADICKAAMLRIDGELQARGLASRMVLQIHDELLFECPDEEVRTVSEIARTTMESVVPVSVPLIVEIGTGRTWADAH